MALGAQRRDIIGMVLRQGMALVLSGSIAGIALAIASTRIFGALLAKISPFDPVTLAGASALFAIVGLAACCVPALRATRVDAMDALRYE